MSNNNNRQYFAFVLMPFDSKYDDVYRLGIKETASELGIKAERLDEQIFVEGMMERIYRQIEAADIVIADMSGKNPNVFYEVGYAHAKEKLCILLTHNANDIPFDLKQRRHIVYEGSILSLKTELNKSLKWAVNELDKSNKAVQNDITNLEKNLIPSVNRQMVTKSTIKIKIKSDISDRVDRVLELIGADEQGEAIWVEDNIEYSIKCAIGNFTYYYVYYPNEIIDESPDIDYILVISVDSLCDHNINSDLQDIRVMLENHKTVSECMKFKYVIASTQIQNDMEDKCMKFFDNALEKANIKNKNNFTFEIWNNNNLSELEEMHGLKVNLQT